MPSEQQMQSLATLQSRMHELNAQFMKQQQTFVDEQSEAIHQQVSI
jgi:hypothetical protein